ELVQRARFDVGDAQPPQRETHQQRRPEQSGHLPQALARVEELLCDRQYAVRSPPMFVTCGGAPGKALSYAAPPAMGNATSASPAAAMNCRSAEASTKGMSLVNSSNGASCAASIARRIFPRPPPASSSTSSTCAPQAARTAAPPT